MSKKIFSSEIWSPVFFATENKRTDIRRRNLFVQAAAVLQSNGTQRKNLQGNQVLVEIQNNDT